MKRHIFENLRQWKESSSRKPLILKGARQVGKTYVLMKFGEQCYDNVAYLNFESSPQLYELFERGLDPHDIIKVLAIELSSEIIPGKTLIFFDEIQECPNALNSLKYFNELANEYHVCAAGSLLGVTLANNKGFPVGKVDFLNLYPFNFIEYLEAGGEARLVQYLENIQIIEPLPSILHEKLLRFFKTYLFVGGMPAAVLEYVTSGDFNRIRVVQKSILEAYRLDFAKHAPQNVLMKINQVWDVIPSQLSKENKKFIYSVIRKGARAQEFEVAIQWLLEAGLIYKIYNISTPKLPLSAYVQHDIFKICLVDIGLLGALSDLSAKAIIYGDDIFQEFKGAITENYVAQALTTQDYRLFYWTSAGCAELDFLLQHDDAIYPLEVKSGSSSKKKSLITYIQKYEPKLAFRTSPLNLIRNGQIINFPLYFMGLVRQIYPTLS
ncbi:MAG: ATP-binding protein [Gammaproteobacteria bacterium]|nr:ATP-binding protein [Gammaproteobacteria bacterium]